MNERYLPPRLLQGVGLLLLIAAALFWALTGEQSALVISAAMGLIGLGSYAGIHVSIRQEIRKARSKENGQDNGDQRSHKRLLTRAEQDAEGPL